MIVKVQISQFSTDGGTHMLIYNKSRTVRYEDVATDEVLKAMDGSLKEFFKAKLIADPNGTPEQKRIQLIKKAEFQTW